MFDEEDKNRWVESFKKYFFVQYQFIKLTTSEVALRLNRAFFRFSKTEFGVNQTIDLAYKTGVWAQFGK